MNAFTRSLALLLFFILTLSCFITCTAGDDDDDDSTGDDDDNEVTPGQAVQALLEEYVTFSGQPGIGVAWSRDGGPASLHHAGLSQLQTGQPLTDDSLFRIGSATKPFIAALTMQLVDEGLIDLDQPLTTYLPEYDHWPGLTIRHLVGMHSGILDYLNSIEFWIQALLQLGKPFTPAQLVEYAIDLPPAFAPGEDCMYSDTNYVLLGMVIERVTGQGIADVLRDRLLDPLGLANTFLDNAGGEFAALTHGYVDTELAGPALGIDESMQELIAVVAPQFVIEGVLLDATYMIHPTFAWAAGNMVSTPRDLTTFTQAWVSGELVSEEVMAQVLDFQDCSILGEDVFYGLGLEREETEHGTAIGHGGLHFGYSTATYHFPDEDLTFSASINYVPDQLSCISDELVSAMLGETQRMADTCEPPASWLWAQEENLLQVRYRGPLIHTEKPEDSKSGLAGTRMRLNDGWRAYNGSSTYAYNGKTRIIVESIGPARTDDWELRSASIELETEVLEDLDENGTTQIANNRTDLFSSLLYDAETTSQPGITRICFFAVPDPARSAQFAFCNMDQVPPQPGDMIKIFANIPMTYEPGAVAAYLVSLDLPACICMDENWSWTPC